MWKVSNEENKKYLDDFKTKLIEPMFKEIINYKKLDLKCGYLEYLKENKKNICKESNKLLIYITKRSSKHVKFEELIQSFIDLNSISRIKYFSNLYKEQNEKAYNRDYDIKFIEVDKNLKDIFTDFFYEKFFDYHKIWELIDSRKYCDGYSRAKFHDNFRKENELYVCPYCDIDTIINVTNKEVEHFLPKSLYPLLSMNAYNLISSCIACNKPGEGKGTNIYIPINSPYNKQIGNQIKYKNHIIHKQIILESKETEISNYLKTLNLTERYKNNTIYELVQDKAEIIYDTIIEAEANGEIIDEKALKEYMIKKHRFSKTDVLTFAVNGAFSELDLYMKYKNS